MPVAGFAEHSDYTLYFRNFQQNLCVNYRFAFCLFPGWFLSLAGVYSGPRDVWFRRPEPKKFEF